MEMLKLEVAVPKETAELGMALGKLVTEGRKMLKDGISVADIPAALSVIMSEEMTKGLMGLDKLPEEAKADKAAFGMALMAGFMHTYKME